MVDVRWTTQRDGPLTLAVLRAFVDEVSRDLDPESRYIRELRAVLDASRDVADYVARLEDAAQVAAFQRDGSVPSHGERGRSWLDAGTWEAMDVLERTLANLLTGETRMMWAGDGAADFARLPGVLAGLGASPRALSIPSSTGKEPFSLAIAALEAGSALTVTGVDRQPAYLERARSGVLVPHFRDHELPGVERYLERRGPTASRVADAVRARCEFVLGDVLTGELPAGPFDLVSSRNLLGYFRGAALETAARHVLDRVRAGGVVLLDPFVCGDAAMAPVRALLEAGGFRRRFAEACFYDAP